MQSTKAKPAAIGPNQLQTAHVVAVRAAADWLTGYSRNIYTPHSCRD